MKTLVELLDAWGKSSGEDETDEEIRDGLVGAFQEWLAQPEVCELYAIGNQVGLVREAGRGLDSS